MCIDTSCANTGRIGRGPRWSIVWRQISVVALTWGDTAKKSNPLATAGHRWVITKGFASRYTCLCIVSTSPFSAYSSDMDWILGRCSAVQAWICLSIIKVSFFGPVHFIPEEFENAALFLRLGLPSTLINPLRKRSFSKTFLSQTGGI